MTADLTLPPASIEAECAVLGGLLLVPDAIDRIEWLQPSAFYRETHRTIYAAVRALIESGKGCDVLLLAEVLRARGELDAVGGMPYLSELAVNAAGAVNITRYAEIVRRRALSRGLQQIGADLVAEAGAVGNDPAQAAEAAGERLFNALEEPRQGEMKSLGEAVADAVDYLDSPVKGLSTGFSSLDHILGGLRPGELIVVAGRPSTGKSALAYCIAEHVSIEHAVSFFSLEMTARQLGTRGLLWHQHLTDRTEAVRYMFDLRLWIDDSSALTTGSMRLRLRRTKRKHGLHLVVVDYLQLMSGRGENRTQEIGSISRDLKRIAKEFNVPVIAVASLNRGVEARTDKRPLLSDLRESGDIESDADVVAMLYRDEYYHENSYAAGFCEVLIRKQREGPTGVSWLQFVPEYARFRDFTGAPPRAPQAERAPRTGTVTSVDWKRRAGGDE